MKLDKEALKNVGYFWLIVAASVVVSWVVYTIVPHNILANIGKVTSILGAFACLNVMVYAFALMLNDK